MKPQIILIRPTYFKISVQQGVTQILAHVIYSDCNNKNELTMISKFLWSNTLIRGVIFNSHVPGSTEHLLKCVI